MKRTRRSDLHAPWWAHPLLWAAALAIALFAFGGTAKAAPTTHPVSAGVYGIQRAVSFDGAFDYQSQITNLCHSNQSRPANLDEWRRALHKLPTTIGGSNGEVVLEPSGAWLYIQRTSPAASWVTQPYDPVSHGRVHLYCIKSYL